MDLDVAHDAADLARDGLLPGGIDGPAARIARGDLVPVRAELRALLYFGVLATAAGVGLLVKTQLDRIGPLVIALALAGGAAACLGWVVRTAPPLARGAVESPHFAFDYVLLLGALLAAADLAYIEVHWSPLGTLWPAHLLIVALAHAVLAVRYDSSVLFSLALSSLAAWRGVAAAGFGVFSWPQASGDLVRFNALAVALFALGVGWAVARTGFKAHFAPVARYFGWLLVFSTLGAGAVESGRAESGWQGWSAALIAAAVAGAFHAAFDREFPLCAVATVAGYVGVSVFVVRSIDEERAILAWFGVTGVLLVALLVRVQRAMRRAS